MYNIAMNYFEVAPTSIVRPGTDTFTYASDETLPIGTIVTIPVGKKNLVGIVMGQTTKPSYSLKSPTSIVDTTPLPIELLQSLEWLSNYYYTPLATVLQSALPRGITKRRRKSLTNTSVHARKRTTNLLTPNQINSLEIINSADPGTILLHGVTGAGKTLVYIEAAKQVLSSGKSVIILVPEIALTSQLVAEFSQHFQDIILTHSNQTEAERHLAWQEALHADSPRVIIGPRSALFMPISGIGLIVIDECHEPSYKQEQSPRYSALRLASVLAKHHKAKVILGSATPSVVDYYLAKEFGGQIITIDSPARIDAVQPDIQLVDMTKRNEFTKHQFLSDKLIDSIKSTLSGNNQVLIFHNRRGSASTTLCENCGWQSGCPRCFVPLTLHEDQHKLRCHICSFESPVPTSCPTCHHADIIHKGIGTKRIESALRRLFPDKNIVRFDGDTPDGDGVDSRYQELYSGSVDIIIGTQIVAKGLDLPHLRTVGIVQADAGLSLPDFGSSERTFQLLAQVIGRVGRSHHPTNVIVQSYQPANIAIQDGLARNYTDFYKRTLALRRHTNFPPFTHLLKLICTYKTEKSAVNNAKKLAAILQQHLPSHVEILGPTPAFYERVRDNYRWQITLKSPRRQDLIDTLQHLPASHWQFELDPTSLL